MVRLAAKKIRQKLQREAARLQEQADALLAMEEDEEVLFKRPAASTDTPPGSRADSPDREVEDDREVKDYTTVLEMVKAVRDRLTALVLDNTNIRAACDELRRQCHSQGVAFGDLSRLVSQTRADQEETRAYAREETGPHPSIRPELLDARGNLRARDIGITWQDGDTFLHGVRITGQNDDMEDNRRRPATAAPYPPCQEELENARRQPAMSTPYQQSHEHPPSGMSTPGFPRPVCIEMSDTPAHHFAVPRQEGRPAHRPAAPIQRFNSKSIGWPAWFRHFRAVADVQGWDKDQRALQMVSYLDEKAMNVAQELSDRELYDYDALVGLLSARFDPASRVSASRSRFHGRTRRHQEDADTYADSITELCRLGYPQSSPELRQELISEQFVRGQSDPELKKYMWVAMEEDEEVLFKRPAASTDTPPGSRADSPDREVEDDREVKDYTTVLEMVKAVRDRLTALVLDNTNIRAACDELCRQCHSQGVAFGDLSRLVSQTRADQEETRACAREETGPHPSIRPELLDARGNLRARDIGITWQDGDTFLHGVRITGQNDDMEDNRRRPATAAPYPPCQEELENARRQPAMSTPYQQSHEHPPSGMSTPGFPRPVCIEMSDTPAHHFAIPRQEGRPAHRPAAPIQRFNSKSIGWPAWFRHFRAVADVQGWDKDQRALQMVSYLDEKAMNVAQELSDRELYDYDALVGLLSARFDPASRVSASRSRFHGRTRRHQEDADTYADSITELCRLGYPQSSPELRQELISEQFVRGQSDPELKKYLWVVIRTQKDKKLQTLIEVCTDFASLSHTTSVHRPAEQVFALEEEDDQEEEMFAVVDRQQWNTQRAAEPPLSPELQQMFALARRMGYEMRPIARRFDAPRQTPGPRSSPNRDYRAPFRPRDYSRTKCFSCGQLGHTQVRCPKPDSSLPFRPSGWVDRSDGPQRNSGGPPQGNEI